MKNASQNEKRQPVAFGAATELVLRIADVAALADQCDGEGNPETAAALRRLAHTLWGTPRFGVESAIRT